MTQEDEWEGLMDPAWERQQTKVSMNDNYDHDGIQCEVYR